MIISEQDKLYDEFLDETIKLLRKDKLYLMAADLELMTNLKDSDNDIRLAFNGVLWKLEEHYEDNMKGELENIIKMIPKIADPENENTLKIVQALKQMAAAEEEEEETLTQEEIEAELAGIDKEEDNSPLI